MIRNLKTLGIALAAIFALSAVLASGASAQNGLVTSDGPWTGTGTETAGEVNNFVAFGQTFSCPGAFGTIHKFNQTPHVAVPSGSSTITGLPHTGGSCKTASGFFLTITMNGCDGVGHLGVTTGGGKTYAVTADYVCPVGKVIEIHAYTSNTEAIPVCTYTMGPQNGLVGLHITDEGTGSLKVSGTITKISVTRDAGLCGGAAEEAGGKATLNGTIAGKNEAGAATAISLSHL